MVLCSMVQSGENSRSHGKISMAPRPHSVTKINNAIPFTSQRSTSSSRGFRLVDDNCDTGSVYSLYKQKIDSMFTDKEITNGEHSYKYQEKVSNCVQAKIEKMFNDISKDVDQRISEITAHSFTVDYLGSMPLTQKITSLSCLQEPLKELYFAYRRNFKHKNHLSGRLEISQGGLKVRYQGDKGDLEQLNPFPTIAVWSAVKFVIQEGNEIEYAFLPLITDPENIDKRTLFKTLENHDKRYIMNDSHSPLFAVVMRKIGVSKQLECHGFVCQTSEDAIVIAATLYRSLISFMNTKTGKFSKGPKNRNGISCVSLTSSNTDLIRSASDAKSIPVRPPRKKRSTSSSTVSDDAGLFCDENMPLKKSTKNKRAPSVPETKVTVEHDLNAIIPYPDSTERTNHKVNETSLEREFNHSQKSQNGSDVLYKQMNNEMKQVLANGSEKIFQRSQSIRKSDRESGITGNSSENSGDILTKVTIPRSGSFLNARGHSRYKSTIHRNNGQAGGGSPLGFSELFNEFRLQEGLSSLDEILSAIINSEGMSFNDLKPIYKEFLLKLAMTLTKDELYQRSKHIMRQQKKKLRRQNSSAQKRRKNIIVGAKGLKRVFRKSFRVKFAKKFRKSSYKKSHMSKNSFDIRLPSRASLLSPAKTTIRNSTSSVSMSSLDTNQFQPKETQGQIIRRQSYRRRSERDIPVKHRLINNERLSTSEDSDFFTLKRNKQKTRNKCNKPNCNSQNCNTQNRNSSSGYVSCSECSYDSDTCTCVSADKCYCSLGNKNNIFENVESKLKTTLISCHSEDKCYCSLGNDGQLFCVSSKDKSKNPKCVENQIYKAYKDKLINQKFNIDKTIFEDRYPSVIPTESFSTKKYSKCCSNTVTDHSFTWCGCDTDSCSDSNKCYCNFEVGNRKNGTIFEQLRERGFVPTSESLVTPPCRRKLCQKNSTTKSTKSYEFLRSPEDKLAYYEKIKSKQNGNRRRSTSSDNLALDYELFTVTNGNGSKNSCHGFQSKSGFGRSTSESGVRSASKAIRDFERRIAENADNGLKSMTSLNGNNDALSMKKSAEIAALFADVKLSQTTDITHLMPPSDCENPSRRGSIHSYSPNPSALHGSVQTSALIHHQNYSKMGPVYTKCESVASRKSGASRVSINDRNTPTRQSNRSNSNRKNAKTNMYNTKNGLYTIQSQSDDSRNSGCENNALKNQKFTAGGRKSTVGSNLENSLGYLP